MRFAAYPSFLLIAPISQVSKMKLDVKSTSLIYPVIILAFVNCLNILISSSRIFKVLQLPKCTFLPSNIPKFSSLSESHQIQICLVSKTDALLLSMKAQIDKVIGIVTWLLEMVDIIIEIRFCGYLPKSIFNINRILQKVKQRQYCRLFF